MRLRRIILLAVALFALYLAGVFVRQRYGPMVVVRNQSGGVLRNVAVKVDYRGARYPLPDLKPGESRRVFVKPVGESSILLEFVDAKQLPHRELLAGYVEDGYCGKAVATVYADRVDARDETFGLVYWKSWLDFVW